MLILATLNLSFSSNLNYCFTSWCDHWLTNVFCDCSIIWINVIPCSRYRFSFYSFSRLVWCTKVTSVVFFINHCGFNQCFYYFILSCDFNYCFCWIYYYWLSYMCNSFSTVWIYCVSRCGCLTSIFSWNSNIILTFFATSIFFVFYWGWDCFYFYFIFHPIFLKHFIKCIFSNLSCIRIFHTHSCWLNDVISAFTIYSSFSNFFYRFNCCNFFILITCPI